MKLWIVLAGAVIIFLVILFLRAELYKWNGRKLIKKTDTFSQNRKDYYCKRLSKMIVCETVSRKDTFEPEEFIKLRKVIKELFPTVSKQAEIKYFSDDCYFYKLSGTDDKRNVMLMSHHDVVAAEGEWKYPPFSGEIAEGCIWGRGSVDTKTPLFAEFSALEELLEEGWKPPCNIYLVSSHNEEIAGDGVPQVLNYLEENHLKFEWILDEGGAVIDAPMSGIKCKCAMLAVHEKGRYTLKIKAIQQAGHGSLAKTVKTPVVRIAEFITQIEKKQPFLRKIHPELLAMFESLAPYMNLPMRMIFANMWCFSGLLKRLIPTLNAQAGSMLGTTCSFKNLQTTKEGDCTAEAFFRCVKEEDLKTDLETFQKLAKEYGVEIDKVIQDEYHCPADLKSEGYLFIKECVEHQFSYAACAPFILPAGTDARHFSELSDAVIRFAPIDINNQQYASVHNMNENIGTDAVVRAVEFYKYILKEIRV